MADRTPTPHPDEGADPGAGTLLNLAAVARMLHADNRVAPEEIEVFDELRGAGGVPPEDEEIVAGWTEEAPGTEVISDLAMVVPEDGRIEALGLAWVTAHADGEIDEAEVAEHEALAELLGLAEAAEEIRQGVEEGFFGSALTVLAALSAVCRLADDADDGRALYADAVEDMELPGELSARAGAWFDNPRPLHEVLSEAASLAPDFQEALLGHLWSLSGAVGADDQAGALFDRFEAACGIDRDRVKEIQAEWAMDPEET